PVAGKGGQDAAARIGRGGNGSFVGPGFQLVDRIDDTAAELAEQRAGAIGPVVLQGAGRKGEELGGVLGAQKARRQKSGIGVHGCLRGFGGCRSGGAAVRGHGGEGRERREWGKLGGA